MTADPREELAIQTVKTLAMDAVQKANSGHPGTPMGLADVTVELFLHFLRYDAKDPNWLGRDRFVLSCGHASMLLYSMLHLAGYDLPMSELESFRQWDSKTPGHPEHGHTVGVETTTGPLGQGIGNAVGFALASKMMEARFGEPFRGSRVFTLCSDGDLMEGVSGEASSLAGHLGLSNLVCIYDDNRITIEGETELAYSDDAGRRYEAYGWFVQHVDGHDRAAIRAALERATAETKRPSMIVARTHIANGAPHAHDTAEAHGAPLGEEEIAETKKAMGWDRPKFSVPDEVRALFADRGRALAKDKADWQRRFDAWKKENADRAGELEAFLAKRVPADLYEKLIAALPAKDDATRNLSGALQQVVAKLVPSLAGGAADLAPSTKTLIKGSGSVNTGTFEGRNLHFGIREHAMGAICNGMALYGGFIPYGSTFLIFSDYMRPSVRLAALMGLQCLWIYTHDSVFLGEDGPTHQPIEQLWSLRLTPNLHVARPADALECAAAWATAIARTNGPTAFALSRQKLPTLVRDAGFDPKSALRGAYVVNDASGGKPDVVIVATGSEVHLATGARERLEKVGIKTRVVSALCLERFAEQDEAYRKSVLPPGTRRVSIEAGRSDPWKMLLGEEALTIGIDRFGASAPDKVLAEKLGLTVDIVTAKIEAFMAVR
jgi:transketolase